MSQTNPFAEYIRDQGINPAELARRLRTSRGRVSELVNGKRSAGRELARRMSELTGKPWHEFVEEGATQ